MPGCNSGGIFWIGGRNFKTHAPERVFRRVGKYGAFPPCNRPCEYEGGFSNIFVVGRKKYAKRRRRRVRNAAKRKNIIWCLCMSCETAPSSLNTLHRRKKKQKRILCQTARTKKCAFHNISRKKKIFSSKRAYCRVLAAWLAMQKLIFTPHLSFFWTQTRMKKMCSCHSVIYISFPDDCV